MFQAILRNQNRERSIMEPLRQRPKILHEAYNTVMEYLHAVKTKDGAPQLLHVLDLLG